MAHIATALFFALVLIGVGALIQLTVRDHWEAIVAALKREMPARRSQRAWGGARVRVTAWPQPLALQRAARPRRVAS